MVSYKLALLTKDSIEEIKLDLKSLDKIDEFTMRFNNEDSLRMFLIQNGLMDMNFTGKIRISYKYNKKYQKLNVVYSDMKKYFDVFYLKHKLCQHSNDVIFLEKLANHYSIGSSKFNLQGTNVLDIRNYLSDVRQSKPFESKMLDIAINDLFEKAVYKINYKTGEAKINYRGLRDLALFISNYEKTINLKEVKNKLENSFKKFEGEQIGLFEKIKKF